MRLEDHYLAPEPGPELAPGAYKVNISATGYKLHSELVSVTSNTTSTVKAVLQPDTTSTPFEAR